METQVCFKCKEEKSLDEFYKHSKMANGHLGKCKECAKKDARENTRKTSQQLAVYDKLRNCRPERITQRLMAMRKRRRLNPEKYKANTAVNNAVRDGRLIKQLCEVCGSHVTEAHHDDYSKPLDVRWLCYTHHLEAHGKQERKAA